jgi:hypothetical protein
MRRNKLTALPKAVLYYRHSRKAGWSFCDGWEPNLIEESWKKTPPDVRPFRDFRFQQWYEIRWLIYALRWARSKWMMMDFFPGCRTYVQWGCGEPWAAINRKTKEVVWRARWAEDNAAESA